MLAQRYRHRIEFQVRTETQDPTTGDITHEWETASLDSDTPLDSVPAEVLTGPGREFYSANAKQSEIAARIQCRWFPGLLQSWRVLWDGQVFDILSIETDATGRREYRLRVAAGVNDGG